MRRPFIMHAYRVLQSGLLTALLLLCLSPSLHASDIQVFPTGPVFQLNGLVWGTSTQPGFNNNFFFTPLSQNESVCAYVKNNNPTNPHTFTASISVTSDPNNIAPSGGTWNTTANVPGLITSTAPSPFAGLGASISGVAQVSINFSNSSTQAGSPDTANVFIIQTQGNCFSGNNFIGSSNQSTNAIPAIQSISDGLSQGFVSTASLVNPTAGQMVNSINVNNGSRSIYADRVLLSCTAACTLTLGGTQALGTTCTNNAPAQLKIGNAVSSTATGQTACATPATTVSPFLVDLAANTPITVDLRGYIMQSVTLNGFQVTSSAVTGTVRANFFWYEK